VFLEQRAHGLDVWQDPLVPLRLPKLFDIRADPFEMADRDSGEYDKWRVERAFALVPAQYLLARRSTSKAAGGWRRQQITAR
jgi:hypothetical protein